MNLTIRQFFAYLLGLFVLASICLSFAQHSDFPANFKKVGYPLMESPHFNPIVINGDFVYVTNTPSSTVDVIDINSKKIIDRIHVGIDPVSLAVRPDGNELWVSNHVSDSVSVIDSDPKSPTFHVVIATIQDFDQNKATTFDEPVGIAFANNKKAYVALSSENQIAVIDVKSKSIIDKLKVEVQDPRAIVVKGDKLYVIPFESGNQTQLSGGKKDEIDGDKVTFDAFYHYLKIDCHNCPSVIMDVVKRKDIPDKDLLIFDTKNDKLISIVSTLGTLQYGLAIDKNDTAYIANTDARNNVNGKAGTKNHTLEQLENRPYLNQITSVNNLGNKKIINLEPLPPKQPLFNETFATPYAVQISDDNQFLVGTAASSNKVFIINLNDDKLISQISVGAGPRGIALESNKTPLAWVYNAFDNSISIINVSNTSKMDIVSNIQLDDPSDIEVKSGRKIFNSATVSTTQTFSCASCHPDGHTDQLLWILETPKIAGGKQIPPRLTNPVRGLRDTEPFHWDGLMGDPYGGITSESKFNRVKPTCSLKDDLSCLKHLISNNLTTLMRLQNNEKETKDQLTENQKNELAKYLLSIPYPAAPKRPYTNILTSNAKKGFSLFHIEGDVNPNMKEPNVCGNCHRMPFLTSTKTSEPILWGMDTPTWRGAYDRHQNQAQGRNKLIDYPWIKHIYNKGSTEKLLWQLSWSGDNGVRTRFDPVWDMVLEMSTGFSGSFARQVTIPDKNIKLLNEPIISEIEELNSKSLEYVATDLMSAMKNSTISKKTYFQNYSVDLISELEKAHSNGSIVLEVDGIFIQQTSKVKKVNLQFDSLVNDGLYVDKSEPSNRYSKDDLFKLATSGKFIGTFTARHGVNSDLYKHPQPAIWSLGPIQEQRGKQSFPTITASQKSMLISGRHIQSNSNIFIDGLKTSGKVSLLDSEKVNVVLDNLPLTGTHLLQIQETEGRFSNEFIFYVR